MFLSAFLVGSVYGRMARERGDAPMRRALLGRALTVYAVHVALLLFLFFVLVPLARSRGAHANTDLASFYLSDPGAALGERKPVRFPRPTHGPAILLFQDRLEPLWLLRHTPRLTDCVGE